MFTLLNKGFLHGFKNRNASKYPVVREMQLNDSDQHINSMTLIARTGHRSYWLAPHKSDLSFSVFRSQICIHIITMKKILFTVFYFLQG